MSGMFRRDDPLVWLECVRSALHYDTETGVFVWKISPRRKSDLTGLMAGKLTRHGYRMIGLGGKMWSAHRLAFLWVYGRWPNGYVDHVNHDRDDNRLCNLREVSQGENNANPSRQRPNAGGLRGVQERRGRFHAKIKRNGKYEYLGSHGTREEAAAAYDAAVKRLYGEHGKSNADLGNI